MRNRYKQMLADWFNEITAADFFTGKSIQELAKAQGIEPLRKLSVLKGGWPDDES